MGARSQFQNWSQSTRYRLLYPVTISILKELMIRKILPVIAALAIANGLVAQSMQQVELAREKIQKWVETRQTISKERSDWKVQK